MPAVTNLYVKFKPSTLDQLKQLDSIMEARNLDLFATPLDYQITQEGDYYQDPSIPMEQITWLYAVVPPTFVFPAGITYQSIASIHIPTNARVEQEAERLAGLNADGDGLAGSTLMATGAGINGGIVQPNSFPVCPEGYYYNELLGDCLPLTSIPPDPVFVPAGRIMVFDTQLDAPIPDPAPVNAVAQP